MTFSLDDIRRYNLKLALKEADLKRKELAELMGVSISVVSNLMTGRQPITDTRKSVLEECLNLSSDYFDVNRISDTVSEAKPIENAPVKRRTKKNAVPEKIKKGVLNFSGDGFELTMDLYGNHEVENEITRSALRIIELRGR